MFTPGELKRELHNLKGNRGKDGPGLVAEMLKNSGGRLADILCDTYNQILNGDTTAPKQWQQIVFKVISKSGDERLPQSYQPIAIMPILYKLFARLLFKRLAPILESEQCLDQARFRKDYSTVDHLFALAHLREKTHEYQVNLWASAVD